MQTNVLFSPSHEIVWIPPEEYDDFYIGDVNVWHIHSYENRPVVLYCHGNGGNISYREYIYRMCKSFQYNLVLFDYSGYGKSKGKPTQSNILRNGEAVYKWLINHYDTNQIVIWGESLGGAVASHVASKYSCRCLILYSTFSSLDDLVKKGDLYSWWMGLIVGIASNFIDTMPTKTRVGTIDEPVIIVHSTEDDVIHIDNAYEIYDNVKHNNKAIIKIRGGHATPIMSPEQLLEMYRFLEGNNKATLDYEEITAMLDEVQQASELCVKWSYD